MYLKGNTMANIGEVHNYYETLVAHYIDGLELTKTKDQDYLTDLFCLALNQLPAYYIRFNVDMIFYTSDEKKQEMEDRVIYAVSSAISWLDRDDHKRNKD